MGMFDVPLPRTNLDEGVLVISSHALSEKILVPALLKEFDGRYLFEGCHSGNASNGGFTLSKPVTDEKDYTNITTTRIEGKLVSGVYRIWMDYEAKTPHITGTITSTSTNTVDLSFSLKEGKMKVTKGEVAKNLEHDEDKIGRLIGDNITCGLDEILRFWLEGNATSEIDKALDSLNADISDAMVGIIFPEAVVGSLNT